MIDWVDEDGVGAAAAGDRVVQAVVSVELISPGTAVEVILPLSPETLPPWSTS